MVRGDFFASFTTTIDSPSMTITKRVRLTAGALLRGALCCVFLGPIVVGHAQGVPPPAPGRSSLPVRVYADAELIELPRAGGLTLYSRHTATDFSRDDVKSRSATDCANQRPLVDAGRDDARAIGAAIRALRIPIGDVLASPTCRTVETAQLIYGRATPTPAVRGSSSDGASDRWESVRLLLRTAPTRTNRAIASHGNPIFAVAGAPYLHEGETLVIKSIGNDFEIIARLDRTAWTRLATQAAERAETR